MSSAFSVINGVRVCYKTVDITNANSQSYVNIEYVIFFRVKDIR